MDETFTDERATEYERSAAGWILAGAGLAALGYAALRLSKGGGGRTTKFEDVTVKLTGSGSSIRVDIPRVEIYVKENARYGINWRVQNATGARRHLSFENFKQDSGERVLPVDPKEGGASRHRAWFVAPNSSPMSPGLAWVIDKSVIAEVLQQHDGYRRTYKFDVWVDRKLVLDPEIVIIRGGG